MQFTEEQATEVKKWVVKRLEDISDADADVLADYVLALIRSDAPDEEIRQASIENLEDFLKENTGPFVDEIFAKYGPKNDAPAAAPAAPQQQTQSQPQAQGIPSVAPQQQPFGFEGQPQGFGPQGNAQGAWNTSPQNSRKRTFNEGFQQDEQHGDSQRGARSLKTPRTRRGGGRGDRMNGGRDGAAQFPQGMPGFGGMPPGFPGFDQNDPMGAMMAIQSMGFPQMPGLPPMPMPGQPGGDQAKSNEPCPFYETNGICYMGAACPYTHGQSSFVVSGSKGKDEYDPANSTIFDTQRGKDANRGSDRGRGRGRGRGDRGGMSSRGRGGRPEFSAVGPTDDKTITTVVVDNIPEDKYNEDVIREHFSEFGNIAEITMEGFKKNLSLIKFDDHESARRAWSSPKAIFDNRFVKVYWYKPKKPEGDDQQAPKEQDTPMFDKDAFDAKQAEAQKVHEERMQKRKQAEETRLALEKQREELMKKQEEEKAKLLQRLGAAEAETEANGNAANGAGADADGDSSDQTKSLRAQLAALEAEAKSLGIDPSAGAQSFRGRGRGASGYRGRGRGGFDPSYRGSYRGAYRGRGAGAGPGRGGVLRLDNRPRRVAISGVELNGDKDEALRQYLIGIGEFESIDRNPDQPDSMVVTFKERYIAEKLMFGTTEIPSVGKVELNWVPNPPISFPGATTAAAVATPAGEKNGGDTVMENVEGTNGHGHAGEVDYDVAEDEDSWGIGI